MDKLLKQQDMELEKKNFLLTYDLLKSTASWLEDPENEIFTALEYSDDSIEIAAKACVLASAILKKAALDIQLISGIEDENDEDSSAKESATISSASMIDENSKIIKAIAGIKDVADSLDSTNDETLSKKAAVLDEILLNLVSSAKAQEDFAKNYNQHIDMIKKHHSELQANKKVVATESQKSVKEKESESKKKFKRPLEAPLLTRHCPDHPGELLARIKDGVYYCMLDGKQYDYNTGFKTMKGNIIPGTSISQQTSVENFEIQTLFQK